MSFFSFYQTIFFFVKSTLCPQHFRRLSVQIPLRNLPTGPCYLLSQQLLARSTCPYLVPVGAGDDLLDLVRTYHFIPRGNNIPVSEHSHIPHPLYLYRVAPTICCSVAIYSCNTVEAFTLHHLYDYILLLCVFVRLRLLLK